jgi:predicted amidohydrolase
MGRRSIAVAQTCPVAGDVEANIVEHLRLIRMAASEGARVIVFPELSLTGYELSAAEGLAFTETDTRLGPLIDAAAATSVHLVVGAPVRAGTALHIGAFILGPGRSVALYTKQRLGAFGASAACDGILPPPEATVFEAAVRDPLIEFGDADGVGAVAVCADIGGPSHARRAAERGANTYLASMFAIPSELASDAAKLERYAVQHSMAVAMANFGSPTGGMAAGGCSSIWSPTGLLVTRLPASGAGVAVAIERPGGWRARQVALSGVGTVRAFD